jgi:hypothetical protein
VKEDILEQLVEDWLQSRGYFTRANLKFKPSPTHADFIYNKDSVTSDIDVIGVNPNLNTPDSIMVVCCKSWQGGFHIADIVNALLNKPELPIGNKETWKHFRELVRPKWTEAFFEAVRKSTGKEQFIYVTAVTVASDEQNKPMWENNSHFKKALRGNPLKFLTLREMLEEVFTQLGTTVEASQFSRTLQLIKAAGMVVNLKSK